ncbi:MAG: helix-turn-helix domain-containing protein [Desulfobulbus sp.]|jgi:excisionase family DNA binding protein|uniref:helix-turn-helix domain-containing protein n=1 Tax=Desulfobulbus sp. TaxID=895 RepID=UPI00284572B6|nr:helix-turn-helix domain-containing protein [Desulfobulbus sp.]MDR2549391.1 helix-turn-helix domain-containing protein [Desulfobulbus sp.]
MDRSKCITYQEAEQMLGISTRAIQRLVAAGAITAYRPGKQTLLSIRDLEIWFESTKLKPKVRAGRPRKRWPR